MSASATDYYTKVGSPGTATTLAAPGHTSGGTSLTVVSTTNWPTGTGVIFAMDTVSIVSGEEVRDVGSYREYEGVVASSTSITGLVIRYGSDRDFAAGSTTRVYIPVAGSQNDRMVDGLVAAGLNQDGTQTPVVKTSINDVNGNEVIKTPATTSAVNEITVTNAATGNAPSISATGGDTNVSLNLRGKGTGKVTIGPGAIKLYPFNYIDSGCVWTADAVGSTLLGTMTSGVVVINGKPLTVAAQTNHTFTASKDTYVDFQDNGDGTASVTYTAATNNAASSAIPNSLTETDNVRNAIIVTGAGSIATTASINQGQETAILPIASSIAYTTTDSLGNLICPRDPNRKVLGYRQITTSFTTTSATPVVVTGLTAPVIVPTGRKIKVTVYCYTLTDSGSATMTVNTYTGATASALTTQIGASEATKNGTTLPITPTAIYTPSSSTAFYSVGVATTTGTLTYTAAGTAPGYILVELV